MDSHHDGRKHRMFLGILLLGFMGIAALLGARIALFAFSPLEPAESPRAQEAVILEIRRGKTAGEIAQELVAKNVIADAKEFVWLGRATRQWKKLKAGEYEVKPGMSPLEIFGVITSGVSIHHPITVREGENMFEIAADLEAKKLATREKILTLCRDPQFMQTLGFQAPLPPSLEGYLYPETYFFNRAMKPEDMIRQMVKKFSSVWTAQHQQRAETLGMNRHQLMTLASMIEKETGAPSERPMISSVFHNRLKKRMRLQSDPTTIYGMWERYKGNIRRDDLLTHTPYNTYTVAALPIGPIGNPGKEAIEAALYPAQSEFLFFVSHNDGTHEFTRSLNEHNNAVRKFQIDPAARTGKSWRDLNKTTSTQPAQR